MHKRYTRIIRIIGIGLLDLVVLIILFFFGLNTAIIQGTKTNIIQAQDVKGQYDVILVLGASVEGLRLSPVLQDRVETAIQMYNNKKTKKVMISGDTGKKNYDEVKAMQVYLRNRGIPASDIIVDTEGSNTFDSIKHLTLFDFQRIAVTTQEFHLSRAIFLAQSIGLNVDGIISDRSSYIDEQKYERRESFSRVKAFTDVLGWYIGIR